MKEITKSWLEFVDKDLILVEELIGKGQHAEVISFHLQQAMEKIIKAYIQETSEIEPPKIHNLIALINIANLEVDGQDEEVLNDLNFIYIESRYPQSIRELEDYLTNEKIDALYNSVKRLVLWIRQKL